MGPGQWVPDKWVLDKWLPGQIDPECMDPGQFCQKTQTVTVAGPQQRETGGGTSKQKFRPPKATIGKNIDKYCKAVDKWFKLMQNIAFCKIAL